MKSIKMALMAGAAIAVTSASASADELQDLKAQVEALNSRMAAMETAPSVPAGYQLLAVSKGESQQIPGLDSSNRDRFSEGNRATIISVMPTADAPAGTTISWSGYVRAAVRYSGTDDSAKFQRYRSVNGGGWEKETWSGAKIKVSDDSDDWDVLARGQLRVVATTDTAVGEVGVELKMRADMDGNGLSDLYMKTAWGYWAMTPELTLGGGYAGSLGNIGYGYDGACTCYYTDRGDVAFDPGDTTQMRLTYASGPFSAAVAVEDASYNVLGDSSDSARSGNNLGVAGEVKYSGDMFSGEISGVYRSTNNDDYDTLYDDSNIDGLWQVGVGVGFNLGDVASVSLAAALGEGPYQTVNNSAGTINATNLDLYNQWWGVSGLVSANLSDSVHAEAGAGYKHREGDNFNTPDWKYNGFEYDTYSFLGGLYYTPVDQLTIGLEGEWYTQSWDLERRGDSWSSGENYGTHKETLDLQRDRWTIDLVSVWRF